MFSKVKLYFNTVKYLKIKQIIFQIKWKVKLKYWKKSIEKFEWKRKAKGDTSLQPATSYLESFNEISANNEFTFLNIGHQFDQNIDWNYGVHGKLWTYNLNYFNFLRQDNIEVSEGLVLIHDFIGSIKINNEGLEPFPTSIRIGNWISFLLTHKLKNDTIDQALFSQVLWLEKNLEYHLMANHLLENAFALIKAAFYFENKELYLRGKALLVQELNEQILADGAHYERAPMYHQLLLEQFLNVLNTGQNSPLFDEKFKRDLRKKANQMLSYLSSITFKNGDIPLVKDSTNGISVPSKTLFDYADNLGLEHKHSSLKESGFRKIDLPKAELFIDIGQITPSYQPGHAHADSLNFVLYINQIPFIVEQGISTYENSGQRHIERSTSAHNTVVVDNKNSSEIWCAFRMAKRAAVQIMNEDQNRITVKHNGYRNLGITHKRTWSWTNDQIIIIDELIGKEKKGIAYLHFDAGVEILNISETGIKTNLATIQHNAIVVNKKTYKLSKGFNKKKRAMFLELEFNNKLRTTINLF